MGTTILNGESEAYTSTIVNDFFQNLLDHPETFCPKGGSAKASGSLGSFTFSNSNCNLGQGYTANGSVSFSWNPSAIKYLNCPGATVPEEISSVFTFSNLSITQVNPTEMMNANGEIDLKEGQPICSTNSFSIPMTLSVSPSSPVSMQFSFTFPKVNLSFSFAGTESQFNEVVITTYDNNFSVQNISISASGTFSLPSYPETFSFSTDPANPLVLNNPSDGISQASSGSFSVKGPNETDVITITSPGQINVTTTINGVTKTTSQSLASLLGG